MFWNLFCRSNDAKEYQEQKQLNYVSNKSSHKVISYLTGNDVHLTAAAQHAIVDRGDSAIIKAMLRTKSELTDETLLSIIERNDKDEIICAFDQMVFTSFPRTSDSLTKFALRLAENSDNITLLTRCANELRKRKLSKYEFEDELLTTLSTDRLLSYIKENGLCEKAEVRMIKFSSDFLFKELLEANYVCNYKSAEKILVDMADDDDLRRYLDTLQEEKLSLCAEAAEELLKEHPDVVKEYVEQFKLLGSAQQLFIEKFPQLIDEYVKHYGFKGDTAQTAYVKQAGHKQLVDYVHKYRLTDKAEKELLKRGDEEKILAYIAERQFHQKAEAELLKSNNGKLLNEYLPKYRLHDGNDVVLLEYAGNGFSKIYLRYQTLSAQGDVYVRKGLENFIITRDVFEAYVTNHFWKLKEFYDSQQS
ncbi:MAG: hypothetical protein MR350_06290 [Alphaproteobacteria bacterium]|nr:hypothetical protein [Alphaproteobacteria bacterium]